MSPCSLDKHGSNSHLTSSGQSDASPATSYLLGLTSRPWAPRCAPDPQHGPPCAAECLVGCQEPSCRQLTRDNRDVHSSATAFGALSAPPLPCQHPLDHPSQCRRRARLLWEVPRRPSRAFTTNSKLFSRKHGPTRVQPSPLLSAPTSGVSRLDLPSPAPCWLRFLRDTFKRNWLTYHEFPFDRSVFSAGSLFCC